MSVELVRKELSHMQGMVGKLFKLGIPNINNVTDLRPDQIYNVGDIVCVYSNKVFKFYKCIIDMSEGVITPTNWVLFAIFYGSGGGGSASGLSEKITVYYTTNQDNTRAIVIPYDQMQPESQVDVFIGGTLFPESNYVIQSGVLVLNQTAMGFAKDREITFNIYN